MFMLLFQKEDVVGEKKGPKDFLLFFDGFSYVGPSVTLSMVKASKTNHNLCDGIILLDDSGVVSIYLVQLRDANTSYIQRTKDTTTNNSNNNLSAF